MAFRVAPTDEHTRALDAVSGVAAAVDRCETPEQVFEAAVGGLAAAIGVSRAAVLVCDDHDVMRFRAWRGLSEGYRAAVEGHSPWPPDATDPKPVVVTDVRLDDELAPVRETILREGIVALAFVPLVHRRRLLGKFMLYHDEPHALSADELRLAEAIASHVASVAERRRVEVELRRSRDELGAILRQVADGITVQDASGRLVYANDAAARLIGAATAEELLETPLAELMKAFDLLDEAGVPFPLERLPGRRALAGENAEALVRWRNRVTGEERWSIVRAAPIRRDDGAVRLAVNSFQDVTERTRAEERFRLLAEASSLLAASLDYRETLQRVTVAAVPAFASFASVWVQEGDEVHRIATRVDDSRREGVIAQLPSAHRLDPGSDVAIVRVFLDRTSVFLRDVPPEGRGGAGGGAADAGLARRLGIRSAIVVPLVARDRVLGVLAFGAWTPGRFERDDLALAEELGRRAAVAIDNARLYAAAEERARAADALAFVAEGVALVDHGGVVRLWNPAAAAITGVEAAGVVGRRLGDVLAGWDAAAERVPLEPGPGTPSVSVPVEGPAGELWLSVAAATFPGGLVYAFRDVTHERELERLKTDFVSTISHELRTPLAAIYGAAVTLRRPAGLDGGAREELLALIASEGDRLAGLIDEVLWASRLDSGRLAVTIAACDPEALAREQVEAERAHLPEGYEVRLVAGEQVPAVAADAAKLRQVLANLLENAIKYSPAGGGVELWVGSRGPFARFEVRDEGLGIPGAERERVFEKFYRLDPELTRGVGGTGLGLYICRELVHRMDGRIWVEARTPAPGSVFVVELPLA